MLPDAFPVHHIRNTQNAPPNASPPQNAPPNALDARVCIEQYT